MNLKPLIIPEKILENTLKEIQDKGRLSREGFVLWLGNRIENKITEFYVPDYESGRNFYQITEKGNSDLLSHLKTNRISVLAQIHSHPEDAFHSPADDRMATVAHVGGLSFVLPCFAYSTSLQNFADQTKVFQLNQNGSWKECNSENWRVYGGN